MDLKLPESPCEATQFHGDTTLLIAELEAIAGFAKMGADKLVNYPYQGLSGSYLNHVAYRAKVALALITGITEEELDEQRERQFQLDLNL